MIHPLIHQLLLAKVTLRTCCETTLCRKAAALMSTTAHLGPPSWSGRYSDTADPYAQYPAALTP